MNSEAKTPATTTSPPGVMLPARCARRHRWPWWTGALTGLLLAAIVGAPLLYLAYRKGKERGRAVERERILEAEQPFVVPVRDSAQETKSAPALPVRRLEPAKVEASGPPLALFARKPRQAKESASGLTATPGAWCFTAQECVRAVWPMELLPNSSSVDHPYFRVREGADRLTGLDNGLCEFVFRLDREASVAVYSRVRYSDECGNSLRCYMDGGPWTPIGDTKVFGQWIWERSMRRYRLGPGLHRLTLQTREDGLEFDRVAVVVPPIAYADLDALPVTPPPVFDGLSPAAPNLPAIGALTAQMFASDSLVIGAGHRNTLTIFLRLNGREAVAGQVELHSPGAAYFEERSFRLTPEERTQLFSWELTLRPQSGYFVPLQMRVMLPSGCVHQQTLNFIRPLAWAFLGPIPDPEGKGLDFVPAPELQIEALASLPRFPGLDWQVVEDGSCYNEFGVVDLNKVFERPNEAWHEDIRDHPEVAYAVTGLFVNSPKAHHVPLVVAGDDCVQAWLNGKPWIRQHGNAPLETSRLVIGTNLTLGPNSFVFKIPQTRLYWQLLFEPEATLPYSHPFAFRPLPIRVLRQFSVPRNRVGP